MKSLIMKPASFYSIPLKVIVASVVVFLALTATASAQETVTQDVTLETGWNIVSTPKVLDSDNPHTFSAAATAENFDIYLLDPSQPSGWATMTDVGQETFTPLYGYFINNKTGAEQTLTFNYNTSLEPNEKLFQRDFSKEGWYSIGVANAEYARKQSSNHLVDVDNPGAILSLLGDDYNLAIDFTDAQYFSNPNSVAIEDPWKAALPEYINDLKDFRETKGYAVYIKNQDVRYSGFQNDAVPSEGVTKDLVLRGELTLAETQGINNQVGLFTVAVSAEAIGGSFAIEELFYTLRGPDAEASVIDNAINTTAREYEEGRYLVEEGATEYFEFQQSVKVPVDGFYRIEPDFLGCIDLESPTEDCFIDFDGDLNTDYLYINADADLAPTDVVLGGFAQLDSFILSEADNTQIPLGSDDEILAIATAEFVEGDALITLLDIELTNMPFDVEPWEVFNSMSLWVDGDLIAEVPTDSFDDYLDIDERSIRFPDLDIVAFEDQDIEIIIAANTALTARPEVYGDYEIGVSELRFFDAEGVRVTETNFDDIGFGGGASFEIAVPFQDLNISLSPNNPDSTDIIVDANNDTNGVTVMVADLEAEGSDIDLYSVLVRVDTPGAITTDVVDAAYVIIDGQQFSAESVSQLNKGTPVSFESRFVDTDGTDDAVWYAFDINGDAMIDKDSFAELEVGIDFNDTDDGARYPNGTTIRAQVSSVELQQWSADGFDDLSVSELNGSVVGDTHTLISEGIFVPSDGFTSDEQTLGSNDTIGEFTLEFEITAIESDFFIKETVGTTSGSGGVVFSYNGDVGSGSLAATLTSTADEDTVGVYTVRDGQTETFTLTVSIGPENTGVYRVALEAIEFSVFADGVTSLNTYYPVPVSDFRTNSKTIQGS